MHEFYSVLRLNCLIKILFSWILNNFLNLKTLSSFLESHYCFYYCSIAYSMPDKCLTQTEETFQE